MNTAWRQQGRLWSWSVQLAAAGICLDETRVYARRRCCTTSPRVRRTTLWRGRALAAGLSGACSARRKAQRPELGADVDEDLVVSVADKLCLGGRRVGTARFRASLDKCRDEEARRAHDRR